MHSFQAGCMDYCNSLLAGILDTLIWQLQSVLRVAAWLGSTIRSPKSSSNSFTGCLFESESTSSLGFWSTSACTMGLLLIWWRWCYQCHTFPGGVCFVHLLTKMLLCREQSVRLGPQGFSSDGASLWNSLPTDLKVANKTFNVFNRLLKTHLFRKAYNITIDYIRSIYMNSGLRCTAPP